MYKYECKYEMFCSNVMNHPCRNWKVYTDSYYSMTWSWIGVGLEKPRLSNIEVISFLSPKSAKEDNLQMLIMLERHLGSLDRRMIEAIAQNFEHTTSITRMLDLKSLAPDYQYYTVQ